MKTTADFLNDLRAKLDAHSDYKLAEILGMHRQHISRYRTLSGTFDDEMCLKIAEILEIDPAEVIMAMQIQREKNPSVRTVLERISEHYYAAAAVLAIVAIAPTLSMPGSDFSAIGFALATSANPLYIMSNEIYVLIASIFAYWPALAAFALFAWHCRPKR